MAQNRRFHQNQPVLTPNCILGERKCQFCLGNSLPKRLLSRLNSPDVQDFINNELKLGEIDSFRKRYLHEWRHQNPARRMRQLPPKDHPWYYKHQQCKDGHESVLKSYRKPPPIVIAAYNTSVALGQTAGPMVPVNHEPYKHIDEARKSKRAQRYEALRALRSKDQHQNKILGRFGLKFPILKQNDSMKLTISTESIQLSTLRSVTFIRTDRLEVAFDFPIRLSLRELGLNREATYTYLKQMSQIRLNSSLMLANKTEVKRSVKIIPTEIPYMATVRATIEFEVVRVLNAKIEQLQIQASVPYSIPIRLKSRRWRHKRRRFKSLLRISTTLQRRTGLATGNRLSMEFKRLGIISQIRSFRY